MSWPLAAYLEFVTSNRRFLGFGFLMAFSSSFGQTYFIGVFGPGVQAEFGLSHTEWGAIYMLGTLGSALLLPWSGKQIDRLDLRHYTAIVCALLVLSSGIAAAVSGPVTLVMAIFLLRHSGQGLASHIASTSMARYFIAGRGRAIAIASLGYAAGEAILPFIAVIAIAAIGWRRAFAGSAVLLLLVLVPLVFVLLRGHGRRHEAHLAHLAKPTENTGAGARSWTRGEVLRDVRFYLLLPGTTAPAMIATAMFFHHLNLADAKGWSHEWITGSYAIYAAATTLAALASGSLVDRLGATRLVPAMLVPLGLAMALVASFESAWIVWPYLFLLGINVGIAYTAVSAFWAEMYGVVHLGAIKSLAMALSVFASALGPVITGSLIDRGVAIESVCLLFGAYTLLAFFLVLTAIRTPRIRP